MSIAVGTRLGSLEITALLGKGGMGEVYRARDTKLKREVAIKILPDEFSRDADRVARFQHEAEVLASLNHPNIASIYDLEEVNNATFLVLELVEGDTLADRVSRGPIPVDEGLNIAKAICEALEAAHEKGIVHRDLKPANVKITPDGKVKVLDFGLAKAMEAGPKTTLSNSPTLSMAATNAGVILGTAAYMSPEQAKGRTVDRRTDIFAFGAVLYEMLTGRAAFDGEDVQDILGAVLKSEPDWARLPANVPPRIRELLRLCLEKNAKNRRSHATDVRLDIEQAIAHATAEPDANIIGTQPQSIGRGRVLTATLVGLLLAAGLVFWMLSPSRNRQPAVPLRLSTEIGTDVSLPIDNSATLALSPDGAILAFAGEKGGKDQLYIRRLGQLQATPLAGTEGATDPFFAPDGQWIAFFAYGKLKKVSISGGASVTLADAPNGRGGAWGEDGNIVFTPNNVRGTGLQRVPSGGGKVEPQTTTEGTPTIHRWAQVLPGAKAILYTADKTVGALDDADIVVQSLPNGGPKIVQHGGYYARYLPSGHLVYIHESTLFAVPFDLNRLETKGQPTPAVEGVATNSAIGRAQYAVSEAGTLAYVAGQSANIDSPISWLDREGKITVLYSKSTQWSDPHFAPDGKKVAMDLNDGRGLDIWIYEWIRDTLTRFSFGIGNDQMPVWTPDGQRIVFASSRGDKSTLNLYWKLADGTGEVQRLTDSKNIQLPTSWHPSGKFLAFQELNPQTGWHVMILSMEGDEATGWKPGKSTILFNPPYTGQEPMFSPDGHWIAYQSNESSSEIYVTPFPGPGGKWQISTDPGFTPTWSRTRHELFYRAAIDNRLMVASYSVEGNSFKADKPRIWSNRAIQNQTRQRWFDLHPDGERFAIAAPPENPTNRPLDKVVFVFNFFDELRRIAAPSKK